MIVNFKNSIEIPNDHCIHALLLEYAKCLKMLLGRSTTFFFQAHSHRYSAILPRPADLLHHTSRGQKHPSGTGHGSGGGTAGRPRVDVGSGWTSAYDAGVSCLIISIRSRVKMAATFCFI